MVVMSDTPTFAELPGRALIAVTGPDARSFLQGLLTQDVDGLAAGELRFGALLTPQGRLLYDLFFFAENDGVVLDVAADKREALIVRLSMYRLRAKVEISTDERSVSVLFPPLPLAGRGPGGGGETPPPAELTPPPPAPSPQGGGEWFVDPRLSELGLRGYGVDLPDQVTRSDQAAWAAHRLALGIPDTADWGEDKTYPIEANFDLLHGIDFKKGCFVGQETTSRMKRRGQIKSRMLPIIFDGAAPASGAEVLTGELRAGQVLSGADGRAIAALRLDRIEAGDLTVDGQPVTVERPDWLDA